MSAIRSAVKVFASARLCGSTHARAARKTLTENSIGVKTHQAWHSHDVKDFCTELLQNS
jgi:hypothetical protein